LPGDDQIGGIVGYAHSVKSRRHITRLTVVAGIIAASVAIPVGSAMAPVTAAAPSSLGSGGEYHPLTPQRIFDSRPDPTLSLNDVAPPGAKPLAAPEPAAGGPGDAGGAARSETPAAKP